MREERSLLVHDGCLNLSLLSFLCFVTTLPARDLAAQTFDAWLLLAVGSVSYTHLTLPTIA